MRNAHDVCKSEHCAMYKMAGVMEAADAVASVASGIGLHALSKGSHRSYKQPKSFLCYPLNFEVTGHWPTGPVYTSLALH